MKKNIILFVSSLIFLMAAATSCSDFLEQPVLGKNADTPEYYDDLDNANMAIIACYNGLTYEDDLSTFQWIYGDVMSDDAWKGGGSATDANDIQELKKWTALSTNTYLNNTWTAWYRAIHRANVAIDKLPSVTFDPDLRDQYIAEAKFIRAFSYFTLVKLYGDIPYASKPVEVSQMGSLGRTPFEQVIEYIITDLKEAGDVLPKSYSAEDLGRATCYAAKGIQARVIMYAIGMFKCMPESAWQDVYDLCDEIEQSGYFRLMPNYGEVFEAEGENCAESLFEIQYATTNTGYNFDNQGNCSGIYVANRGTTENPQWGWGFNCPTQDLVDEYEANDPRRECTVHGNGITPYLYGLPEEVDQTTEYLTGYQARKLAIDPALRPSNQSDSPSNQRILRYSDVLLMKAEAAYHLNDESTARTYVNKVRERARNSAYPKGYNAGSNTYPATGFTDNLPDIEDSVTGTALLDAIKHERRVELAMESLRYWDLVRWGDYAETLDAATRANFERRQLRGVPVIPIPSEEVAGWGLEQNPM